MSNENDAYTPPKPVAGDIAHTLTRAGIGAIPIVGASVVEIFAAIVTPPLERRRAAWMERVGEALRGLEGNKGIDLETLQQNEAFIDVAMQATQAAFRNSQNEKLDALKNAILNSALPHPPEESQQQMFISFIDTFSVWHLRILDFLQSPEAWARRSQHQFPNISASGLGTLIESAFQDLRGKRAFYDQIGKDLAYRGLAKSDSLHVTMTGAGLMQKRTTEMGDRFLDYIRDPLQD